MGSKYSPPPAPDPKQVAAAQTGSNVATAIANAWIGNANERGPLGNVDYRVSRYRTIRDSSTGTSYKVPVFTRTTTLTPDQQTSLDLQNKTGIELNSMALNQSKRLAEHLSQPFSPDGLPEAPGDFEPYRQQVESGLMERMNPQLERDRSALESKLVNQGLVRGSDAFTQAMDEANRQANDARTQIFLTSGDEARAAGNYQGNVRQNAIQEQKLYRDQPINEISALMNGGQVSMPQFQGYRPSDVAGTPIGQYYYQTADLQRRDAQAAAQDSAAMWGALGNIGAGLFRWSDSRLKTDIRYVMTDERGINWYTFRYNGDQKVHYGVMAQEVMDIVPDAVRLVDGFYMVDYGKLL